MTLNHLLYSTIETLKNEHGERFLQISNLTTPWYLSFRCILLRERELQKNNNRIGLIRTDGTKSITITPYTSITVNGYVDKEIPYQNTPAIVQSTTLAKDSDYDSPLLKSASTDIIISNHGPIKGYSQIYGRFIG